MRPISNSEELTIGYCNLGVPRTIRQKQLQDGYIFTCKCPRCSRTESLDKLWAVNQTNTISSKLKDLRESAAKSTLHGNREEAAQLLREATALCKRCNSRDPYIYEILLELSTVQINGGQWQSAFETCEALLPFMEQCYDARSPTLGLQLMLHGKLAWFLELTERSIQLYERSHLILSVTHGKSHSLVEDLVQKMGEARAELIHKKGTKEDRRKLMQIGKMIKENWRTEVFTCMPYLDFVSATQKIASPQTQDLVMTWYKIWTMHMQCSNSCASNRKLYSVAHSSSRHKFLQSLLNVLESKRMCAGKIQWMRSKFRNACALLEMNVCGVKTFIFVLEHIHWILFVPLIESYRLHEIIGGSTYGEALSWFSFCNCVLHACISI